MRGIRVPWRKGRGGLSPGTETANLYIEENTLFLFKNDKFFIKNTKSEMCAITLFCKKVFYKMNENNAL